MSNSVQQHDSFRKRPRCRRRIRPVIVSLCGLFLAVVCTAQETPAVSPPSPPPVTAVPTEPLGPISLFPVTLTPTNLPTNAPTTFTRRPSATPSYIEPTTPPPTHPPTALPTPSPTISNAPSSSSRPSNSPSVSSKPSAPPTNVPSAQPSQLPSMHPTITPQPSARPSAGPSSLPTISSRPSESPTVSPAPTITDRPSSRPSSAPTRSAQPSDQPSTTPTLRPSASLPSQAPSMGPSTEFSQLFEPALEMVFGGIDVNWTKADGQAWANLTSWHVRLFWDNFPQAPALVRNVTTLRTGLSRLDSPQREVDLSVPNVDVAFTRPLVVSYNQTIRLDWLRASNEIANWEQELFLLPFQLDQKPYTDALAVATNNTQPIVLLSIRVGMPPTPAPTPKPSGKLQSDRNIIIVTVVITTMSVGFAGGYLYYLTRKDDVDPALIGEVPSESYDEDDFYRESRLAVPVTSIQAPPTMYPGGGGTMNSLLSHRSADGVSSHMRSVSNSAASAQAVPPGSTLDTTEISSMSTMRRSDPQHAFPSVSTLPITVISDNEDNVNLRYDQRSLPRQVQYRRDGSDGDEVGRPREMNGEEADEQGPSPLAMMGFQMEIQDLDDYDDDDDDDDEED